MGSSPQKILVVGAGLAGLAAAWELRRAGCEVTVLERELVPGGRARGAVSEGFLLEPLSPVISSADRELLSFIARVGVQDQLLPPRPVTTAQVRRGRAREIDPRTLVDLARIPGVRPWEALRLVRLPRLLRRHARLLDAAAPERAADLDDRSLADFGRLYFGQSVLDRWLGPLTTSASLGDAAETSRVLFLLRQLRQAGARRTLPRAALAELCEAAAAGLATLHEAQVECVEPDAREGFAVTYTRDGRQRTLTARGVVLAVDPAESARIAAPCLATGELEVLRGVRYTPALTLAVATCRPLALRPAEIRVPHAEGLPIETALIEPGLVGGRVPDGYGMLALHGTGPFSEAAFRLPDETIAKELLDAFEQIHPGARAAVDFTRVFRTARARPRFDVGHYRKVARHSRIEAERRAEGRQLVCAGDWRMDPSWNGAVASGLRSARELLEGRAPA